jgi:hypothetical protein
MDIITQQRKSDGYCDLGIACSTSEILERKLSKFVDSIGSEVDEDWRSFLADRRMRWECSTESGGTQKRRYAFAKYSSISLKDDI